MTLIAEGQLRALLVEAAEGNPAPVGGADRIAAAVTGDRPKIAAIRSMAPTGRWSRAALVAAAVVVVAAGVAVAGTRPGTSPDHRIVAGAPATVPGVRGPVPSTTVPPGPRKAAGSSGFGTATGTAPQAGIAASTPSTPIRGGPATSTPPLPTGIVGRPAKVVTTGTIDLALGTGPVGAAATRLTTIATGAGGFVAKSDLQVGPSSGAGPSSGTLVLQVPQAAYAAVLIEVQAIAKVTSSTSTSTDVTGQYVDLQARIDSLQASRQQYLTILGKATSIGDILAVQSQLDTIQSQIEQLQGQLDLLNGQTTFATLTVSLSQSGHRAPPPPPARSGIDGAWHQSVSGFTSGVDWLVRIAGRSLFVLLLLAVLAFVAPRAWRAWRRRTL